MNEMIERIAMALCRVSAEIYRADDIDGFVDRNWMPWTVHAEAALKAMREPTEAMVRYGWPRGSEDEGRATWRDMIAAALEEVQQWRDRD